MNPNKALWEKGDFTRIAASMRDSGEALVAGSGSPPACRSSTSAAATAPPRCRPRGSAPTCSASTSRATSSTAGNRRAEAEGLTNCRFQEGDASRPRDLERRLLRPGRQHLRRDVRAQAVRCGQGDGPRDPARRPDRHGELDPQRPDAGRADPQDQLGLLAAAAGRVRQPDDLGRRGRRHRTLQRSAGIPPRTISFVRDTYRFNFPAPPADFVADVPHLLRPDDERVRRRRSRTAAAAELADELVALFERRTTARTKAPRSIPATFLRVTVAV